MVVMVVVVSMMAAVRPRYDDVFVVVVFIAICLASETHCDR